jgi:phosphatidylglycerophosphatase A
MTRLLLVTAGGLGLLRPAPGTWGSLPPAVAAVAISPAGWMPVVLAMAGLVAAGSVACILLAPWYERHFGRADPGEVVCDEVAGMALCLSLLPWDGASPGRAAAVAAAGFVLFRILDILKPPPIMQSQRLPRGWGVLADDLLAGLAAAGLIRLALLIG